MEPYIVSPFLFVSILSLLYLRRAFKRRLPPGPPGYPVVGNIFDVDKDSFWVQYAEMSRTYDSDVISLNMAGNTVIILNTLEGVQELLEKRSAIYSDRPDYVMLNDLSGLSYHFAFMRYDERWKEHRKLFKQEFQPPANELHRPNITMAVRKMLPRLLESPENFDHHLRHMNGMFVLSTSYGLDVQPTNDPYVSIGEKTLKAMAQAGNGTEYLVEHIPILKYLPDWMPGARFKAVAKEWSESVCALPRKPMEAVYQAMENGVPRSCVATRVLGAMDVDGERDPHQTQVLQNVLGAMYAASTDTA
ncbi:hypothetical protein AAF712_012783 [Marasmius tenuissimus]|uniref:Cytochrome P450 n=1 Tax=Marasmius tenuissimus TaxID=585030 RepID=A0ABR2ZHG3_9AGAR|nr:hypothetical protein PM082_010897 [Marasmius tenuissimus]